MKEDKKVILHLIVSEINKGKNPAKISKENNIKKQTLQYYLRQLKKDGVIVKEGYGVWKVLKEVSKIPKGTSPKKQIRGHAFIWKVKSKEIDWEKRLKKNNISYQYVGIKGNVPRILFKDKKIWLTKKGLTIYEPKSFFSQSSMTSKGMAVWELDKTIKALGRYLKIDIGGYQFTTSREHYAMLDNELARQYDNNGEKLCVRRKNGSAWMWVDFSHGVNELENDEPVVNRQAQKWFNNMKETKFEVTPTFILEAFNKTNNIAMQNAKNHSYYAENMRSHIEAIQTLSQTVKELKEEVKRLRN